MDTKAMKVGIVSGIISSLIVVIFIQPILSFIGNAFVGIAGTIQQGYVDRLYRNAAIGDRNLSGHMAFLVLLVFLYFGSTYLLLRTVVSSQRMNDVLARFLRVVSAVGGLALSLVLLVGFSLSSGTMEISASFTQRLTVLAPAISDVEYKTLKAR